MTHEKRAIRCGKVDCIVGGSLPPSRSSHIVFNTKKQRAARGRKKNAISLMFDTHACWTCPVCPQSNDPMVVDTLIMETHHHISKHVESPLIEATRSTSHDRLPACIIRTSGQRILIIGVGSQSKESFFKQGSPKGGVGCKIIVGSEDDHLPCARCRPHQSHLFRKRYP